MTGYRSTDTVSLGQLGADMSWGRVLVCVLICFGATVVAAFPFGVISGILVARGCSVPPLVRLGQAGAVFLALTLVFTCFAWIQTQRPFLHLALAGVCVWAQSLVVNGLLLGLSVVGVVVDGGVIALSAMLGALLGMGGRRVLVKAPTATERQGQGRIGR